MPEHREFRPETLAEVARRGAEGPGRFDAAMLEFLDHFYTNAQSRADALAEEPTRVGAAEDAYLAAAAEHLALSHRLATPAWTQAQWRFLERPLFAGGLEALKAILIVESPSAFRRRSIFISADALDRPRMLG